MQAKEHPLCFALSIKEIFLKGVSEEKRVVLEGSWLALLIHYIYLKKEDYGIVVLEYTPSSWIASSVAIQTLSQLQSVLKEGIFLETLSKFEVMPEDRSKNEEVSKLTKKFPKHAKLSLTTLKRPRSSNACSAARYRRVRSNYQVEALLVVLFLQNINSNYNKYTCTYLLVYV